MALHGKASKFEVNNVDITGLQSWSDTGVLDTPVADATAIGDAAQVNLKGIPGGGTITLVGVAATGTRDHAGLGTLAAAAGTTPVAFEAYPEGASAAGITGTCHVLSYSQSGSFGGVIQWQATLGITGAVAYEAT